MSRNDCRPHPASHVRVAMATRARAGTRAAGMVRAPLALAAALLVPGCASSDVPVETPPAAVTGVAPQLPAPQPDGKLPKVNIARPSGWRDGETPTPAAGLSVNAFACGLQQPRWLLTLPGGQVLVAESGQPQPDPPPPPSLRRWATTLVMGAAGKKPSADRITLLADTMGDGRADQREPFLADIRSPFGMARVGATLYIGMADGVVQVPLDVATGRAGGPVQRLTSLPGGRNHHWTKNVIATADGRTLYATVGSNSNVGENGLADEEGRAAIWKIDLASGAKTPFATGLRNPNGMAFEPATGVLWTVVNERDELGPDLPPDYLTSVRDGDFFGWPWLWWGTHADDRAPARPGGNPTRAKMPDYALGAHVAALGLVHGRSLTGDGQGMFIGRHGSWNRVPRVGYDVVYVPFVAGRPSGLPQPVLTGFVDAAGRARGRPVGVEWGKDGALLVADDVGNCIWRVTRAGK